MLLLCLFALLAGAGTAISPCVLPILPALLSAGASGGRRRPLGIVIGLATTFTVTIVGLASVADGVGLGDDLTRDIAIVTLAGFGLAVLVPKLGDRLEAPLSRLAKFGPKSRPHPPDGFSSGLLVGAALGFLYAPCAGPILAAVIAVSAASGKTVLVGASYALGSAAVLFALLLGGRAVTGARAATLKRALGATMLATAVAMAFQLDVRFQTAIADHLPSALVNPTKSLEESGAVKERLADLRGHSRFERAASRRPSADLPELGQAPEFVGTQQWFNSPPLTLERLRGRVVLIDFWTYTCINCIRTLPYLKAWDARYRRDGLTIVGVHAPEFSFEKRASNVAAAIKQNGLRYPVVQDNDLATWSAWQNQYWPAKYLIDAHGEVRYVHFGEGKYEQTEAAIRELLAARGATARPHGTITPSAETTPETYLGSAREGFFVPRKPANGTHRFRAPTGAMDLSTFAFDGTWLIGDEAATAVSGAGLQAQIRAKDVYLVLSSAGGRPRQVRVAFDGRQLAPVTVTRQRLYQLVSLPQPREGRLSLRLDAGISGFAFTFG